MSEASWKKCRAMLDGVNVAGLLGFTYEIESDDEHLFAAGDKPIDIQSGNVAYRGVLKALKSSVDAMNRAAQALGYNNLTEVKDLVLVFQYLPEGQSLLQTDTALGVKFYKLPKGWDQGAKSMPIELPFNCLDVKST